MPLKNQNLESEWRRTVNDEVGPRVVHTDQGIMVKVETLEKTLDKN